MKSIGIVWLVDEHRDSYGITAVMGIHEGDPWMISRAD